ncbi:hypothetical protein GCM10027168_23290 [Streptomyces capparidis]
METTARAFRGECERLVAELAGLPRADWHRPTACEPWTVAELLAHVRTAVGRLTAMLAGPPVPGPATVSAREYYRPDARFSAESNAERVATARRGAADGADPVGAFDRTWREVYAACLAGPADRVVRTRHGDPMLTEDFLLTRVVEVVVHGVDLALALDREPWTTPAAASAVEELLLGAPLPDGLPELGWDRGTVLRKATGRDPMSAAEEARLAAAGLRRLTLG